MRSLVFAAALSGFPLAVLADEVWYTMDGEMVYETDLEPYALISAPWDGDEVMLYVDELAFNYDARGVHGGFWIGPAARQSCDVAISAPDGRASYHWGRIQVTFDQPSFPTGFTVLMGSCFDEPDMILRANLAAG
ncbi:hypothetical protein [Roseisalinus antarcticus]|uniref:Uncharacterized protein n=1 Tax=Roseisalinus antarcticus TaxID=254357 RepID=A0A1Y5RT65_9RHOB|nr:hypothetical protein [Roseisalinus antarcticus]SLN22190.1 hypothetical protein ROA7023_00620 [Roseisalinus antarcticus]